MTKLCNMLESLSINRPICAVTTITVYISCIYNSSHLRINESMRPCRIHHLSFFFYCWQCWAVLESKGGNIRRARELFDAATVADAKHIAAWHGWAILEIKQGNIKKARNLLGKALKYCGGNEYIYQTLALLEAKAERFEQAQTLFQKATQSNPKSCASWLVSIWFIVILFFPVQKCRAAFSTKLHSYMITF